MEVCLLDKIPENLFSQAAKSKEKDSVDVMTSFGDALKGDNDNSHLTGTVDLEGGKGKPFGGSVCNLGNNPFSTGENSLGGKPLGEDVLAGFTEISDAMDADYKPVVRASDKPIKDTDYESVDKTVNGVIGKMGIESIGNTKDLTQSPTKDLTQSTNVHLGQSPNRNEVKSDLSQPSKKDSSQSDKKNSKQSGEKSKHETASYDNKSAQSRISMKTRTCKIDTLIDFINKHSKVESPGKQLQKEQSEKLFTDDSPFNTVEGTCDFLTDCVEWLSESIVFWSKRQCTCAFSSFQNKMMKKKFKRRDNVIRYGDFMFYEMDEELMLFKYVGVDTEIIIPSYVEGLPVRYLEKGFLKFNSVKSVGRGFSTDNIQQTSMDSIIDNFLNIKKIQLPETLAMLPSNVFKGCKRIDEIIIPESVEIIQPNAFKGCRPSRLIFLGEAPKQLENCNLSKVKIYCNQDYFDSFYKLISNYGNYVSNERVKHKFLQLKKSMGGVSKTSDLLDEVELDLESYLEDAKVAFNSATKEYEMLLEQNKSLKQQLKTLIDEIKNKKKILKDRIDQYNYIKNYSESLHLSNAMEEKQKISAKDLEQIRETCLLLKRELDALEIKYRKLKKIIENNESSVMDKKDVINKLSAQIAELQKKGA